MRSIIGFLSFTMTICTLFALVSCDPDIPSPVAPAPPGGDPDSIPDYTPTESLHLEEMRDNIDAAFEGNVVGYGWAAYKDGDLIGGGGGGASRIEGVDGPEIPYTAFTEGTVFSTSKTITAAAVVDQLSELGYDLDMEIKDFLPEVWRIHSSHDDITFRDLLAHTSGLTGTFDRYTEMRDRMVDPNVGDKGTWVYSNINYTLFRVIIPYLFWKAEVNQAANNSDDNARDFCADRYENFIKSRMAKVDMPGHNNIDTYYTNHLTPTLYYNFDAFTPGVMSEASRGLYMFDCHDISGAGGWFMNPVQYASFIDGLFNGQLVDADDLVEMKEDNLGMYQYNGGKYGTYYTHNGGGSWANSGKGGECQWMHFPEQNVSLFIAWNSINNNLPDGAQERNAIFASIFEEAWHK